MCFIFGIIVQ